MKYVAAAFLTLMCISSMPAFVHAQTSGRSPAPTASPTIPPVLGNLPSADGGLFAGGDRPVIRLPNLISAFTGEDFLDDIFKFVVDLLATIGGILAFFYIIYGGVKFVTSGGSPSGAEEGKKMIIGAIIGIVIISLAYVVVLFIRDLISGP